MSSVAVRTAIKTFIDNNSAEDVIDLTGQWAELEDLLSENTITYGDPWVGIQFIGSEEVPISVGANNVVGKYREMGAIFIHVVDIAKLGGSDSILARAETLRNLFRGQRIGDLIIESVSPTNFEAGATLRFEGGWMSGSFMVSYESDLDL